ncbi:MAG: glycosyltransferase family 2 protein [Oscillospiraceae bacterium]|nr:glycosyltransferase family 2 protein [Oscillospiraceae bacterium]
MAEISVIIPVYKAEKFLPKCIDSILAQTFQQWELILMDDGSPDRSGEICDAYACKDGRIHVIHQANAGVCAARNNALDWVNANSDSQWIFFIDNDDWMHPRTLELLYQAAQANQTKLSICGYAHTAGEEVLVQEEDCKTVLWNTGDFYRQHFVNATVCWGKLYHKSCFDGLRYPVGKFLEDEFLTYRLLFADEKLAVIPAPLYAYYYNPEGITKSKWVPKRLDAWEAYEQQLTFFAERNDTELIQFRYRGYLENALVNLESAQEANSDGRYDKNIRFIKKRIRNVIRRAWNAGAIHFWHDYDMLYRFYPYLSRIYRLYREVRYGGKWRRTE